MENCFDEIPRNPCPGIWTISPKPKYRNSEQFISVFLTEAVCIECLHRLFNRCGLRRWVRDQLGAPSKIGIRGQSPSHCRNESEKAVLCSWICVRRRWQPYWVLPFSLVRCHEKRISVKVFWLLWVLGYSREVIVVRFSWPSSLSKFKCAKSKLS